MPTFKKLFVLICLSLLVLIAGTLGYMALEGWEFLESLYMTAITVTTVGFGEVRQLSTEGRVFTVALIFVGVGLVLYVTGFVVQFMVEGQVRFLLGRRKLNNKIKRLKNHYIVCGYGRIGRVLTNNLRENPIDIVVVENNPELVDAMEKDNVLYIQANATEETALLQAGIKQARGLVAVLATDTDNVFLTLTARQLNPDLYIMARVSQESARSKLWAAGADKVESPYDIGATSMAMRVLRPSVTNFLDLVLARKNKDIQMEEIPIFADSEICDMSLMDSRIRQRFNIIIIAIRKSDETMIFNPSPEEVIQANDTIIVVGEDNSLARFNQTVLTG
ncbi:MAG: potassium channel protein [Desulfosudaceae bacterium]